jgi:hypothetical protein
MARLWRLSVVVIVLTLAPQHAWAGCAWVLWEEGYFLSEGHLLFTPYKQRRENNSALERSRALDVVSFHASLWGRR